MNTKLPHASELSISVDRIGDLFRCEYEIGSGWNGETITHYEDTPYELEKWMALRFGKRIARSHFVKQNAEFWNPTCVSK